MKAIVCFVIIIQVLFVQSPSLSVIVGAATGEEGGINSNNNGDHKMNFDDIINEPHSSSSKSSSTTTADGGSECPVLPRSSSSSSRAELSRLGTFAGTFTTTFRKLFGSDQKIGLPKVLGDVAKWEDAIVLLVVGWFTLPLIKYPYEIIPFKPKSPFSETTARLVCDQLQQLARIALIVYVFDIIQIFCAGNRINFCSLHDAPHAFAQSAYLLWVTTKLISLRRHYFMSTVSKRPELYGQYKLISRLADATIYVISIFIFAGILKVKMGIAIGSIFALGGAGTLAVGFASKDILNQIFMGLYLAASNYVYEGDKVRLKSGAEGTIVKLGWLETVLRGSDEVMLSIPNSDMIKQSVSNLSRVKYSRVRQVLHFKYTESSKLPVLLNSIKREIELACPDVISDGSRPFRAIWTDHGPKSLEVVVEAHFNVKPIGDEYWNNRQKCLQAINRAVAMNQVEFAC